MGELRELGLVNSMSAPPQFPVSGFLTFLTPEGVKLARNYFKGNPSFIVKDSEVFINSAMVNEATISSYAFHQEQHTAGIDTNLEAVLENVLKNAAECAARDVAKQVAADKKAMDELTSHIRKAIMMECLPGGVIWRQCRR